MKVYSNRVSRLVLINEDAGRDYRKRALGEYLCSCGTVITTLKYNVLSKKTMSCGCMRRECGYTNNLKHGLSKTQPRLYRIFSLMKDRCYNKNNKSYNRYGGRGIFVCSEWLDGFPFFYNWAISNGYKSDLTIDRINNDAGYSPENCRWATYTDQNTNKCNVLGWEKATELREDILNNELNRLQLAKKYNISTRTVSHIKSNKSYTI